MTEPANDAGAKADATYAPIEVINLTAEVVFKMSAGEAESAKIQNAGDLRKHGGFRRAFTDATLGHTNEKEVYPLHLTGLVIEGTDDELKDDSDLTPSEAEDDGTIHLHAKLLGRPLHEGSTARGNGAASRVTKRPCAPAPTSPGSG